MPWVKLDDQFPDHPKVVRAGPAAAWLYVCGLAYCARQLTNGEIPTGQLPKLVSGRPSKLAAVLVDVELWEPAEGGFKVHDYLQYNPTREQVLALRKQKADAGRRGGYQKAGTVPGERQPPATGTSDAPVPTPTPVPSTSSEKTLEVRPGTTGLPPARATVVAPVPKVSLVDQGKHLAIFRALRERFGNPANDAEAGKYGRAAKLLVQAGSTSEEVFELAATAEQRWGGDADVTPLGIAGAVTSLRTPVVGRSKGKESSTTQINRALSRYGT